MEDDSRLTELYIQAYRARFWANAGEQSFLNFVCLAEKALKEAKKGTEGRLFYSLVKAKDFSRISMPHENRAISRFGPDERQAVIDRVNGVKQIALKVAPDREEVNEQLFGRKIGFHHGIMVQCFLPQQKHDDDFWQSNHGKASLAVEAGRVADPTIDNKWIKRDVPFGSRARLIMPYIVGYAVQHDTPIIDMGASLRRFLDHIGMSVGGAQGHEVSAQIENIAGATIRLGMWGEEHVRQRNIPIAEGLDFWLDKNPNQQGLWQQEMCLDPRFFEALQEHRVPVDMDHLVKLSRTARRQDLYVWLSYRLPKLRRPLNMPLSTLQSVFGQTVSSPKKFREKLRDDLKAIAKVYDGFNLELRSDYLSLRHSKSPIPHQVTRLIPKK